LQLPRFVTDLRQEYGLTFRHVDLPANHRRIEGRYKNARLAAMGCATASRRSQP
jgi:hypothetical protein